jgi:hypothetical protein
VRGRREGAMSAQLLRGTGRRRAAIAAAGDEDALAAPSGPSPVGAGGLRAQDGDQAARPRPIAPAVGKLVSETTTAVAGADLEPP